MLPVSVVIPCYRCHATIEAAVGSVLAQTILPKEIILVEDCSGDQDRTIGVLERISHSNPGPVVLTVLRLPENRGPGEARNAGWNMAKQELIAFLDADDTWHPEKLALQASWMLKHPDYVLSCHASEEKERGDLPEPIAVNVTATDIHLNQLLYRNGIATRTVMLRRSIRQRFPAQLRHAEDYYLWLKILMEGGQVAKFSLPLAYSYVNDHGVVRLSADLPAMHAGVLRCLMMLRDDGLITMPQYVSACLFETLKYWFRSVAAVFSRSASPA